MRAGLSLSMSAGQNCNVPEFGRERKYLEDEVGAVAAHTVGMPFNDDGAILVLIEETDQLAASA